MLAKKIEKIILYTEGKGTAEQTFINIYVKKLNTKLENYNLTIICDFKSINNGGGLTRELKNKLSNYTENEFIMLDIDDKQNKAYDETINLIKKNNNALVSNRQFEYWLELYFIQDVYRDRKEKDYYEKIKNKLKDDFISLNINDMYSSTKRIAQEEQLRHDNNFDYDRAKSFSTMYRLINYLDIKIEKNKPDYLN